MKPTVPRLLTLLGATLGLLFAWQAPAAAQAISAATRTQIDALLTEKASRTPAQRKLDSQLIYSAKKSRRQAIAAAVPTLATNLQTDAAERVLVDLKAAVSQELLDAIVAQGGEVVNHFAVFGAIRAHIPISAMETLAGRADVHFIGPAAEAITNLGSVTSEGDRTHRADTARATFPTNGGSGIKVGVLSDGVNSLATSIANGNLRSNATVIAGQAGSGDEGTAMMEIVQDLVPDAQVYFATALNSPANFAANILALKNAGCRVIVDDVSYLNESPFQDQVIAQAVQTVSDAGVLYFSSAGNSGSKDKGTAGTWEGDFADGGEAAIGSKAGRLHDFGSGTTFNTVGSGGSSRRVDLFWTDPLGASSNDYDLFVTDSAGAVLRSSTNFQTGTQDPYETISTLNADERIVIVKTAAAAPRFLHLDTGRATLAINTPGKVRGHNASGAANAFSVAATDVHRSPSPNYFVGGATNPVETFSSDGPRRMFFLPNGTPITPGNFTATGGSVLQKPDFTAADGGSTSVTGFTTFYGTSAAAPHAAGIAALLLSYNRTLTPAQVRTLLTSTALDIEGAGYDRNSGSGIIMALAAVQAAPVPDPLAVSTSGLSASGPQGGPFTPTSTTYTLTNNSAAPLDWTASKTQPWLTLSPTGGTLAAGASTTVTVALDPTATAALPASNYTDAVTITDVTTSFAADFPVSLAVVPPDAPVLFDSFTGGSLFSISPGSTFSGFAMALGTAGGTSNITVAGGTAYMVTSAAVSYTNIRLNITFWSSASGAVGGPNPAFSGSLGTYSIDFGPLTTSSSGYYTFPFTLPTAVVMPSQTGGVTINWQGDTGSGPASTTSLSSLFRYGTVPAAGSMTLNGYYVNASGETDGNFLGSSYRTISSISNQGLALKLTGLPVAPLAATNAATNVTGTTATLNASVNPGGLTTTASFASGTTTNYGNTVPVALSPSNGTAAQNVSAQITGLIPNTTYHFRATATNYRGTSTGRDLTFTTLPDPNAPVVTTTTGSVSYLENATPTAIDPGLTITDLDDADLVGATVAITGNFSASEDTLTFANQSGISGSYNSATGVLTLSGTASVAAYQTALRTVAYGNSSDSSSVLSRTVTFIANDGNLSGLATRGVTIIAVNDAPTLDAIDSPLTILEDAGLQTVALSGISAGGGESQALTVTATSNNPTVIPNPSVSYASPNTTGTLGFTPVLNASGSAEITVRVQDNGGTLNGGINFFTRSFTVNVTPVNDPPAISGAVASQTLNDTGTKALFTPVTISDPDSTTAPINVSVVLDAAEKGAFTVASLAISGFSNAGAGVYTFTGAPTAATTAIRQLIFAPTPNRLAPGLAETTTFTISASDGLETSTDATTTAVVTSVNDAPTIAGTVAGQATNDTATVTPFAGVTIGDADSPAQSLAVSVTLDTAAKGTFTVHNGFSNAGGGVYVFNGPAASATAAIRGLVFAPTPNRVAPGTTETTTFTISASDGIAAAVTNSTTSVIATSINDAPAISGTVAGQPVNDDATLLPFASVTISDLDLGQTQTVSVTLDAAAKGTFTAASLVASGFGDAGSGLYTFSGTATAATTAIRQLVFAPTPNHLAPSLTETTTFTLSVNDGIAAAATNNTTTVIATSINDPPTIAGTVAGQPVNDDATLRPFASVTVSDLDLGQTQAVSVTLDAAAKGTFTTASLTASGFSRAGSGVYTFSGTVSAATLAIRQLVFEPTSNRVAPGTTETTTFTLASNDGLATATNNTTTVVATSINDVPSITGALAGLPVNDNATLAPFSGVTFNDADSAQTQVVSITLDTAAKGTFTAASLVASGFSHAGNGVYTFSGTAAAATAAIRQLVFAPTPNRLAPGLTETTAFTLAIDDGIAAAVTNNTTTAVVTSINDAPTVTGTVAGQPVNDNATVAPFAGVTLDDADSGQTQAVSVTLDAAKGVLTAASLATSGFSHAGSGVYNFSGTAVAATAAIRQLVFAPTPNRLAPGTTETAIFAIAIDDGLAAPVTNNATTVVVTSINDPPVITGQQTLATAEDTALPITLAQLSVSDPDNDYPAGFTLSVQAGANYSVAGNTITPAPDYFGQLVVPVTVNDGLDPSAVFNLSITVTPVNDPPTLAALSPLEVPEDAPEQTVTLTGITAGAANETDPLTVTASSSDPALIPTPTVSYTPGTTTGTLKFTPVANRSGQATITVTVDDGQTLNHETSRSFLITVTNVNDPPAFTAGPNQSVLEDAGPQTVPGWATAIVSGPEDEAGQALTFLVESDNAGLFAAGPAIAPNGTLSFTPATDAHGSATVTVRLKDDGGTAGGGADTSAPATFVITVAPVNDAPSFAKGANQNILQKAGAQTVAGWATAISAGPADEAAQVLHFSVTTDNDALFATLPTISPAGTLAFAPSAAASGTATVTVVLRDDGGTTNGGVDASAPQTFTINSGAVNDPPSFVIGGDQSAAQDAGPQTVPGFATDISPGPADEAGQQVDFRVTVDHPELFRAQPAISPTGTLTYMPDLAGSGSAIVTVRLHDDGGGVSPDSDLSEPQSFKIAVTSFTEEVGTYNGLALPSPGATPGADKTGLLRLTLTKKGKITGKLSLGAFKHRFTGTIDHSGIVTFGKTAAPATTLKRKAPLGDLTLSNLRVDVAGGSDTLTGAITDGTAPFATLTADRALYSGKRNPAPPFRNVSPELIGNYTVIFDEPQAPDLPASGAPHGDGYGTLKVSKTGVAKLVGKLADGSKIGYANALSKLDVWPLWAPFDKGAGALAGPVHFRKLTGPAPSDLDGLGLLWFKPKDTKARYYPNGWPGGITTDLLGSLYVLPPKTPPASVVPSLGIVDDDGNAQLTFTGGGLAPLGLSKALNITAKNKILVVTEATDKLKVTLAPKTGLFKGSFRHPVSLDSVKFEGALFQAQQFGSGFFLGPEESGAVTLVPAAEP